MEGEKRFEKPSLHISPVKKTFNKEEDLHFQVQCDSGHKITDVREEKKKNRSIFAAYWKKQLILLSIAGQETAALHCLFTVQGVLLGNYEYCSHRGEKNTE